MSIEQLPGFVELHEAHGETTVVLGAEHLLAACLELREQGFNFLSDITAVDYLGYGGRGVAAYIATSDGRDLNSPMTQGLQATPAPKPTRFAVHYHLLSVSDEPRRLRVSVFVEDGEPVPSVIEIWPTADWHEREAFDLMGIPFAGHPNLVRILTDDDWDGHPLRKDYPIGGEPVRFSGDS